MPTDRISDVAHVIQLAVAPVFLLTSLGTFLAVLSTRLGRIVDRARVVAERIPAASGAKRERAGIELALLVRRRHLVNVAITFCTSAALLVCLLIAIAFAGSTMRIDSSSAVALLFILAMLAFIGALVTFLAEILLAVGNVRLEPEVAEAAHLPPTDP